MRSELQTGGHQYKLLNVNLTSVDIVHPSSHIEPRELVPCTRAGSMVKQSPTFITPGSVLPEEVNSDSDKDTYDDERSTVVDGIVDQYRVPRIAR